MRFVNRYAEDIYETTKYFALRLVSKKRGNRISTAAVRYVFSFDTGEEHRQTLDFSVVAFLKSRVVCNAFIETAQRSAY